VCSYKNINEIRLHQPSAEVLDLIDHGLLTEVIDLNPNYSLAYNNKGEALLKLNKIEDAIKCFDKAIELNPNNSNAIFNKKAVIKTLDQ
jgi:tetratricopeptide (TPR) repeat protein